MSRFELSIVNIELPDLERRAIGQANDSELQKILTGVTPTSLKLRARQTTNGPVHFDSINEHSRLFVPTIHRRTVFAVIHGQAHGGRAATC